MVSPKDVEESNSRLTAAFPSGLVAVFVGATNGIGEYTLKQFAKQVSKPRVYFIGRSQEAGTRIVEECKKLNAEGEFNFIRADTSSLKTVDGICEDIKSKEKTINLLWLSTGILYTGTKTEEGLHMITSLAHYSRARFILNLLPLIQQATGLRRVVSCFTGTKEGAVDINDIQGWKLPLYKARGHASSLVTATLQSIQARAPEVSFIHDFPGPVKSGITRGTKGPLWAVIRFLSNTFIGTLSYIPNDESGERHLYLCTSAKFPAGPEDVAAGVARASTIQPATSVDGKAGGGVYSIDEKCEGTPPKTIELLAKFGKEGTVTAIFEDLLKVFKETTGSESI